ncbi:glycoside hydrolase family 13 protein [Formosa algae]|uniref:Glycosidase n=1 Tax=Formosa algae TaxID=225843 RepID=A0A9X0YLR3_9FLAO|nr:glycoside hydrolase family 13 protein [Formosa algae]MBP1839256.1 glycosidase [Formosa algae]MDQ0334033.1 glycosidase [Formosa algae]OEI79362.1 alpha-amlyase [Formosa algae]
MTVFKNRKSPNKSGLLFFGLLVFNLTLHAQITRVEPPNWWVGFKNTELQLLVHATAVGNAIPNINYPGVTILNVHQAKSPNYLFIDLNIDASTKPGVIDLRFQMEDGSVLTYNYELKSRVKKAEAYVGFNSSDAMYLITPDRFANGNSKNDSYTNLNETGTDRADDYARHGGDIQGIINHLDYIQDLGFTSIWPTPLLTNNMSSSSYHGYAITDFYQVDPRFGTLEDYKALARDMDKRGLKLIMDMVANHCGSLHWWMEDLPFEDWINQQQAFESQTDLKNSNHRRTANQDLYASKIDKKEMTEGWFVPSMPDLNQTNPFMAKYIIQNNIWWIETLGLSGIRQDTYPYSDKYFMSYWAKSIMDEYPNFSIVGEEWSTNPLLVRYWQSGTPNKEGYESYLTSTMDFPMQEHIVSALNEAEGWDTGFVKMYEGLAMDFAYTKPEAILIFPDNHDMDRVFTQLHENVANTKMAFSYMCLMPRILQMYYGTEILMQNSSKPDNHGLIRSDFPGGWKGDSVNAFSGEGLTTSEIEMQDFVRKIINYRKQSQAIHKGKTIHFAPEQGVYVLARLEGEETVVLILNKNENENELNLNVSRFEELGLTGQTLKNIITGEMVTWNQSLKLTNPGPVLLTTKL